MVVRADFSGERGVLFLGGVKSHASDCSFGCRGAKLKQRHTCKISRQDSALTRRVLQLSFALVYFLNLKLKSKLWQ
jgi:hypothetical protein